MTPGPSPGTRAAVWNLRPVDGGFVERDGAFWYRIRSADRLRPFLTAVASSSDHWIFASSRGPLTAGRRDLRAALFPYLTEDRLHDAVDRVGGKAIVQVEGDPRPPWEPGAERGLGTRDVSCDLWKDVAGTALCSEEHEHELGLTFRVTWTTSARFGIVRRVAIENRGTVARSVRVLDGLLNLLPADVDPGMQAGLSNLVDAYKTARLVGPARVGVFALSSIPGDRAEPNEALRATTVWCAGADGATVLLSERQLDAVRRGEASAEEPAVRGERGAYLVDRHLVLAPGAVASWAFVCEVEQDGTAVTDLLRWLAETADPGHAVELDVAAGRAALVELVRAADGVQATGDAAADARHFSNVLHNAMRGGTFPLGHAQHRDDFAAYLREVAPLVWRRHRDELAACPARADVEVFRAWARARGDADLLRLHLEYLPLAFSRRHGDPSRPWNRFSIRTRDVDGSLRYGYEGNWRDIFQNWEALARSFPSYAEAFVARFVNASTADGYNPYRVARDGVDWEVHDPDDPWSNIGYWGDHQIVYLTRLLESCEQHGPGRLAAWLDRAVFVYVDVPYRIRAYDRLLADPFATVDYDAARAQVVASRVAERGAEGKLVVGADGEPLRVTLAEKLLVPFLVKLTNFVPGAGVWMNTQRPEWNDANNALVGRGASIVTVCALWRHAAVLAELFAGQDVLILRSPVAELLAGLRTALDGHAILAATGESTARRALLDEVGRAGEAHRRAVYGGSFGAEVRIARPEVDALLDAARAWLAATIDGSRRSDGLYHAYNLVDLGAEGRADLRRLAPMLEGQVAVLGCGILDARASVEVLEALRASPLHGPAQRGFLLYPDRDLPSFLDRNVLPADLPRRHPAAASLFDGLRSAGHRGLIAADGDGTLRFRAGMRNAAAVAEALDALAGTEFEARAALAREEVLAVYEEVFDHAAFTGRSGTFFGYEGLGCVYWHMVSKLAVALLETIDRAREGGAADEVLDALRYGYREVRESLGVAASPDEWGAFPTDAYSHTPGTGGARQPGMTGQVKEDILCRLGELGLRVRGGRLRFDPFLLPAAVPGVGPAAGPSLFGDDSGGPPRGGGELSFSLCGVPIHLGHGAVDEVRVTDSAGRETVTEGLALGLEASAALFARTGEVLEIRVRFARG
jgi:hypothetical protein